MKQDKLMNAAGIVGWIGCAIPTIATFRSGLLAGWPAVAWWAAFLVFGVIWLRLQTGARLGVRYRVGLLVLEATAAIVMVWTSVGGVHYLSGAMFIFVTSQLPLALPPSRAWTWWACQSALLALIFWRLDPGLIALSVAAAYGGFSAVTLSRVLLMHSEREARMDLARTNAELRAARELLAENSRVAERLRIARDLHDSLGHHLTALSIRLDVAARHANGAASKHVEEAHAIARLLLSDVRDVVGQLRLNGHANLSDAIRTIAVDVGELKVHLQAPDKLHVADETLAQTILRCVQEIITNSARHARADNLWIGIESDETGLRVHARDDGCGAAEVKMGNGLKGMSERFRQHAGQLHIVSALGKGFELHAAIPRAETTS
jgi:signal transduction histidine kinase